MNDPLKFLLDLREMFRRNQLTDFVNLWNKEIYSHQFIDSHQKTRFICESESIYDRLPEDIKALLKFPEYFYIGLSKNFPIRLVRFSQVKGHIISVFKRKLWDAFKITELKLQTASYSTEFRVVSWKCEKIALENKSKVESIFYEICDQYWSVDVYCHKGKFYAYCGPEKPKMYISISSNLFSIDYFSFFRKIL